MASIAESISALLSVPPPPVPTSLHGQADRILRSAVVGRDGAGPAAATRQYKNSQDSFHSPNHHSPRPRGGRVTLASTMPANAAWGGAANSLAAGSTDLQVSYSEHHRINRIYELRKKSPATVDYVVDLDQPDDARGYLKAKLAELKRRGLVHWDMLIPPERRPPLPQRAYWDDPWDDNKPTEEMFHR
eukprot:gene4691-19584_t